MTTPAGIERFLDAGPDDPRDYEDEQAAGDDAREARAEAAADPIFAAVDLAPYMAQMRHAAQELADLAELSRPRPRDDTADALDRIAALCSLHLPRAAWRDWADSTGRHIRIDMEVEA